MMRLAYRTATDLAGPLLRRHLASRAISGKEEPSRIEERFGIAGIARPAGRLGWLHGASVGEMQSLLPLIEALPRHEPGLHFLVTTGTVTSARLLAQRRPANVLHQYLPLDRRAWVARFLDHWRPDFALWVESEFWPNLLQAALARGIPLALVNGRRSKNEEVDATTQIYLADTLGELGLFYRLAPVVFVAGSYRWQGHNPIEPALLARAVASGPRVMNFQDIFDRMAKAEAVIIVTEAELAQAIDRLLADPQRAADRAEAFARGEAGGILDRIVMALDPVVSGKSRSLGDR